MNKAVTQLWAKSKPRHPLWRHMLDIAAVAKALTRRFGGVDPLPHEWVLFIIAMHDIGKASPLFQWKANDDFPELTAGLVQLGFTAPDPRHCKGFRHEALSAEWLGRYLDGLGWSERAVDVVCQTCRGHHGNFGAKNKIGDPAKEADRWENIRAELAGMVASVLDVGVFCAPAFSNPSEAGVLLAGLTVFSDWIASNDEVYGFSHLSDAMEPVKYYRAAVERAVTVVDGLGIGPMATVARYDGEQFMPFNTMWPHCSPIRPIQIALERAVTAGLAPGMLIIEAPMGEGKTEAAVYVSEYWNWLLAGRCGTYIALPTQATSNQMFNRYRDFLPKQSDRWAKLVHGMAWLVDDEKGKRDTAASISQDDNGDEAYLSRDWFRNAKRALLAPEGVGTVDQVMLGAMNVKHGFLRLFGLAHKVLVIDECHAYDIYMTTILELLLRWCRALRVPVILLSATLSHGQKQRLLTAYARDSLVEVSGTNEYPAITMAPLGGSPYLIDVEGNPARNRKLFIERHYGQLSRHGRIVELAVEEAQVRGGCVCVICNTVGDAQTVYELLSERAKDVGIKTYLFHARNRAEHRQKVEKLVTELFGRIQTEEKNPQRPDRAVLVATQVVEQSLDVDFDVMISQMAPVDLLLQRAGRLWRHLWNPRCGHCKAVLHVLMPERDEQGDFIFGGTALVYDRQEYLLRTLGVLDKQDVIELPADLRELVRRCYDDNSMLPEDVVSSATLRKAMENRDDKDGDAKATANQVLVAEPNSEVFSLADISHPETESENGDRAEYIRKKTRQGEDSMPAIILHSRALFEKVKNAEKLPMKLLKYLMLQKVNIAVRMVFGERSASNGRSPINEPKAGYELVLDPPALRGHALFLFIDREWVGARSTKGGTKSYALEDNPTLGIVYHEGANFESFIQCRR